MIKMKQPSLVLHSCDVPGYKYQMWKSWLMPKGASASDVVYWINWAVDNSPELALSNVIINCHGSPGFLHVGGDGCGFGIGDIAIFKPLRTKTIGKIWLVACEVAKNKGSSHLGTTFCSALARETGCFVIAAEKNQHVDWWFEHISSPYGTIDDYEGQVFEFSPAGGFKAWKKSSDD
jgi:hypothetical protein